MKQPISPTSETLLATAGSAIRSGGVAVISVEAIRARSADRWLRLRPQVEEFLRRTFARVAGPSAVMAALNDVEFVTVQPERSWAQATSVNATVLEETLSFFVGKPEPRELRILQVTGYANGQMTVRAVDGAGMAIEDALPGIDLGPNTPPAEPLVWATATRTVCLTAESSRHYNLTLKPEPAWLPSAGAVASILLRETLTVGQCEAARTVSGVALPGPVAGAASLQSVNYALELLQSGAVKAAVHAPVFLEALTYSHSRYALLRALKLADLSVRRFLVLELVNLPAGLPPSRMIELVGLLLPCCRMVLARAPDERFRPALWRGCGLGGVTLECDVFRPGDRSALGRLSLFAASAATVGPVSIACGLRSRSLMLAAWAAGFTQVSGAAVEAEVRTLAAQRFEPARLYRGASGKAA